MTTKLQCYRICEHLESVESESVHEAIQAGKSPLWLDLESTGSDALETLSSMVEMNPVMAQCCRDAGERPRAIPCEDAIFFEFPVYTDESASDTTSLVVLCLRNLVITIHPEPIEALAALVHNLRSPSPLLPVSSISALVCVLLIQQSDGNLDRSLGARRRIDKLDATMDRDPDLVTLEQILDEKDRVRVLDTVNEECSLVFNVLKAMSSTHLDMTGLQIYFQLALSNAENLTRSIERLESRLNDLNQRYVGNVQDKTNQRLALLTIISAVFMPSTLLAGIYGMNFDTMPELHFAYSYPVALGTMATIAVSMWIYFKRKGWLG